jgi:hypothetical protein
VTASIRGRDEAASRLATAIGWFWTVYTAAALVGIALADRVLPAWMAVLLALPAVLLVAAYALVIWALNPIRASLTHASLKRSLLPTPRLVRPSSSDSPRPPPARLQRQLRSLPPLPPLRQPSRNGHRRCEPPTRPEAMAQT